MPPHHTASHEISTPRLILRSPVLSDAQAICELRSDPANSPHEPVEPGLTLEIQEQRINRMTASSSSGKNGFMVIVLPLKSAQRRELVDVASEPTTGPGYYIAPSIKDPHNSEDEVEKIIGFGGFNAFSYIPSLSSDNPGNQILLGDVGVMIDHRYWRQGYGVEALTAIIDYGFDTLDCGRMFMGTELHNVAWKTMMNKTLGLTAYETREKSEGGPSKGADGFAWRFGKDDWENAKSRRG